MNILAAFRRFASFRWWHHDSIDAMQARMLREIPAIYEREKSHNRALRICQRAVDRMEMHARLAARFRDDRVLGGSGFHLTYVRSINGPTFGGNGGGGRNGYPSKGGNGGSGYTPVVKVTGGKPPYKLITRPDGSQIITENDE